VSRARRARAWAAVVPLPSRPWAGADQAMLPREAAHLAPRRPRLRLRWRRYAVLAVAMYCAVLGRGEVRALGAARAELRALRAEEHRLLAEQARLRGEVAYAQTNAYVLAAARREFGFVAPDEVPLAPLPPPTVSASPTPAARHRAAAPRG
jgi:cell division protein FtsB